MQHSAAAIVAEMLDKLSRILRGLLYLALGGDIDRREVRVTSKASPLFSTLCRCTQSRGGAIECTAGSLDTNRAR
jgi:hypothetical protein